MALAPESLLLHSSLLAYTHLNRVLFSSTIRTWLRPHVVVVSPNYILFDGSVHDTVAMGVAGLIRRPEQLTTEEVEKACQASLMHGFARDLPDGCDTRLGNTGASLSGGQKQRLAIARAMLRDPTVLVLGKHTIACDRLKD